MFVDVSKCFFKLKKQGNDESHLLSLCLYSDEYYHLLREPIKCIVRKKLFICRKLVLLVEISPTLLGTTIGVGLINVRYLLLRARYGNAYIRNLNKFPIDVLVYLPKNQDAPLENIKSWREMICVAWAVLDTEDNFLMNEEYLNEVKLRQKDIQKNWLAYFTELQYIDSENGIFKRMGPFLIGIEFWMHYEKCYEVLFSLKSLMNDNEGEGDFELAMLNDEGQDCVGSIMVDYNLHKDLYLKVCEAVARKCLIDLHGELLFEDILNTFVDRVKQDFSLSIKFCYVLAQLSLLVDNESEQKNLQSMVLNIIEGQQTKHSADYVLGLDVDTWSRYMQRLSREKIMKTIEKNVQKFKIEGWKDYLKS